MNYDKILERIVNDVNFSEYDAFSTSKYCHYITIKGKELALIWQSYDSDVLMGKDLDAIRELRARVAVAVEMGARLPRLHSFLKRDNYIFQIQDRAMGKKFAYYEILASKTTVEDFIEVLKTIDIMYEVGLNIDQGYNCMVDDDGHINLFDYYLTLPRNYKVNSRPYLFHDLIFREPQNVSEDDIKELKKIMRKLVKACVIYFHQNGLKREVIYAEIMKIIKDYSFISMEEKNYLINEIMDETLQIAK